MKIKLDENLPARLIGGLVKLGHDVDSVPLEALSGQPDVKVWEASQEAQRFLITQDLGLIRTQFSTAMLALFEHVPGFEALPQKRSERYLKILWSKYRPAILANKHCH